MRCSGQRFSSRRLQPKQAARRRTGRELSNSGSRREAPSNHRSSVTASLLRPLGPSGTSCPPASHGCRSTRAPLGILTNMTRKHLDPKIVNIFLDSCAFDPKYSPEDKAALTLFRRSESDDLLLQIAHSTQKEIEHPNTPGWVKQTANNFIYTIETSLVESEQRLKAQILKILAGNGKPENVTQDAQHVFEAAKYGSYFVTTDHRILQKRRELCSVCDVDIVTPSELLEILRTYENT